MWSHCLLLFIQTFVEIYHLSQPSVCLLSSFGFIQPTNHLDIPAKQMLEEALQNFQGSVVVISHDRYFISKVATTIVAIEDKKLVKYSGDYKFYMDKSAHVKAKVEARYVKGVDRIGAAPIVDLEAIEIDKKKKSFGGAKTANLVTRKDKGVKNAKRQQR